MQGRIRDFPVAAAAGRPGRAGIDAEAVMNWKHCRVLARLGAARLGAASLVLAASAAAQGVSSAATAPFPNFESGAVRPLLLSPDGERLYVLNTPDHRLEVFATQVSPAGVPQLSFLGAVFTGLEPVSMALHPDDAGTLFVANLLSDSVSVVDLATLSVRATIAVGDEPQDVLVTGGRLCVATARSAEAPSLTEPGEFVENALVIADATAPYTIRHRLALPAHKPRALAEAGGVVYVLPQNSGNHTTVLDAFQAFSLGLEQHVSDAFDPPFTLNPALQIPAFLTAAWFNATFLLPGWSIPTTGRIVMDFEHPTLVPQLADFDLLAVDAANGTLLPQATTGVGTTLLALARNPATGALWVANTQAHNRTRFEPVLSGVGLENRITVVSPAGAVQQVLAYGPGTSSADHAQPAALAFYAPPGAGSTLRGPFAYVGALGDGVVVVHNALTGAVVDEFFVGELPTGLAVDEARALLYVFTRGDLALRAYSIANGHAAVGPAARGERLSYNPEPKALRLGRRHLYDARVESGAGSGTMSCASCHIFGHADQLAWDLGDPGGGLGYFYPDLVTGPLSFDGAFVATKKSFMTHPMKGPMVTQSLRGLDVGQAAPLHWRGDRRFFQMFRGAFRGLLGGSGISPRAMQEYAAFVRSLSYPPNPHQPKDREYTDQAAAGRDLFGLTPGVPGKIYNPGVPGSLRCVSCHVGDFAGKTDFTGGQPTVNFDGETQLFNSPTLRGAYEKEFSELTGFGVLHDGSLDDLAEFLNFEPPIGGEAFPALNAAEREQVVALVRAWDTGTAPLVGAQFTASEDTWANGLYDWLDLTELQAAPPAENLDLIGKGALLLDGGGEFPFALRFAFDAQQDSWRYQLDVGGWVSRGTLVSAIAAGQVRITFTCVPPGMGLRLGIDRDEDGLFDGAERVHDSRPWSPDSDGDGYADGLEVALGGNPAVAEAFLPDATPPAVLHAAAHDVFTDTATLQLLLSEPARVQLDVGTAPGDFSLASFSEAELLARHDLILDALPGGTLLFWRATLSDKNGNAHEATGSVTTAPPLFHVDDITLTASGRGSVTLTATVRAVDHTGAPVVDLPVRGLWAGPIGGADFFPVERTDAGGVATFIVGPYSPTAGSEITFSVALFGVNEDSDPFAIGRGGDTPTFFYNASANLVNYRTLVIR
ncbi:MAG: hypothetical protein ACT4PU_09010 [Planctomycetota bacterium]